MKQVNVAIIGAGWCGGIRAVASAASPWVKELHIAEIREERLKEGAAQPPRPPGGQRGAERREEVPAQPRPFPASSHYRRLLDNPAIDAVMISTTPEPT